LEQKKDSRDPHHRFMELKGYVSNHHNKDKLNLIALSTSAIFLPGRLLPAIAACPFSSLPRSAGIMEWWNVGRMDSAGALRGNR